MSFRLGRVRFEVSFPLVCLMTAAVMLDSSLSVLLCFLAALLHELGHLAALRRFGTLPREIRLTLFDIAITDTHRHIRSSRAQLVIALAGVVVNFACAGLCLPLASVTGNELLRLFGNAHLTLGLFNSLPVSTLDGAQALSVLLSRFVSPRTLNRLMKGISLVILLPAACCGFLLLFSCPYHFSLLLTSLYLLFVLLF